jgi:hypothetical protein
MPGLDQPARHREAHLPEADESDIHDVIPANVWRWSSSWGGRVAAVSKDEWLIGL